MADPRSRPYCRSPKLRKALNTGRVTMLQSTLHAIHFKHILNFGEPQPYLCDALGFLVWFLRERTYSPRRRSRINSDRLHGLELEPPIADQIVRRSQRAGSGAHEGARHELQLDSYKPSFSLCAMAWATAQTLFYGCRSANDKNAYWRKSKVSVSTVSVFAGSYFHSLSASRVALIKSGWPPIMFLIFPSGPIVISTFTVPTKFIRLAISGYLGVGFEIAFRASWADALAANAHRRMAAQTDFGGLMWCLLFLQCREMRMARR